MNEAFGTIVTIPASKTAKIKKLKPSMRLIMPSKLKNSSSSVAPIKKGS